MPLHVCVNLTWTDNLVILQRNRECHSYLCSYHPSCLSSREQQMTCGSSLKTTNTSEISWAMASIARQQWWTWWIYHACQCVFGEHFVLCVLIFCVWQQSPAEFATWRRCTNVSRTQLYSKTAKTKLARTADSTTCALLCRISNWVRLQK
jgi:hypothetical protein